MNRLFHKRVSSFISKRTYYQPLSDQLKKVQFQELSKNVKKISLGIWNYMKTNYGYFMSFGTLLLGLQYYPSLKEIYKDVSHLYFRVNLANSIVEPSLPAEYYIDRSGLQEEMKKGFEYHYDGNYYIIYGEKGVGKTELVNHVASKLKGVVRAEVTVAQSKEDILKSILKALHVDQNQFDIPQLKKEIQKVKDRNNIQPIIIFEVERGEDSDQVKGIDAVRSMAKLLAVSCCCIIVLSEANTVLRFGRDRRENYIYVGELSRAEAKKYLAARYKLEKIPNTKFTDDELDKVFERVGTSPAILNRLLKTDLSAEKFADNMEREARGHLASFPLKSILKALKDHPDGVAVSHFEKQTEKGIHLDDPLEVGPFMKGKLNPIVYRLETGEYQLLSTAHKTALKNYDPKVETPVVPSSDSSFLSIVTSTVTPANTISVLCLIVVAVLTSFK